MFRFKSIYLLFTQLRAPPLTEYLKQQHFTSIVILLYTFFAYSNNCSLGLYSSDLRTTIILFLRSVSLHKNDRYPTESHLSSSPTTDWISTESPLFALSCLLYHSSLMNALVWECLFKISINVNKLFIVYFVYVRPGRVVVACLFLCPLNFLYGRFRYIFVYSLIR